MIDRFRGEYKFLSNFCSSPIIWEGSYYPCVENAYQASKTLDEEVRKAFTHITPGVAKRLGRSVIQRRDWNEVHLTVMLSLLRLKFESPVLKRMLLATGDAELIEGNDWGDRYWGQTNGIGENHLGRLLMQVRSELRGS